MVYKKYLIENKFVGYVMGVVASLFAYGGVATIDTIYKIPEFIMMIPFYSFLIYLLLLFLIKDFLFFVRIFFLYMLIGFMVLISGALCFLIYLIISSYQYLSVGISIFLFLFLGAFLWDIIVLIKNDGIKKMTINYDNKLKKIATKDSKPNYIDIINFKNSNYRYKSNKLIKLFLFLVLPFALLGKGLGYILAIEIGRGYDDGYAYILSALGFPLALAFLVVLLPQTVAFFKLRYPYEN